MEHEPAGTIAVVMRSVVLFTLLFAAVSAVAIQPKPSLSPADVHQAGSVDVQFFSVFAHPKDSDRPGGTHQRAHDMIDALLRQVERDPERLPLALPSDSEVSRPVRLRSP